LVIYFESDQNKWSHFDVGCAHIVAIEAMIRYLTSPDLGVVLALVQCPQGHAMVMHQLDLVVVWVQLFVSSIVESERVVVGRW
jgi:hypothetical protein